MKIVAVFSCALLLAGSVLGQDIYTASMKQARRAVANTEAASNRNPDAQTPNTPAGQALQPMDPALAATLKNIAALRADLLGLTPTNSPSTALTNDLMAAATGTKPSADAIAQLVGDLQTAVAGNAALRSHYQQLAQFLHAALNGSHLTPAQFQAVSDGVEKILDGGGVSYEAVTAVTRDLKAMFRATQ